MGWFAGAHTRAMLSGLAAISCLLGGACGGESNKDVSGAYEVSFDAGAVRALLYLIRSPDGDYLAVLDGSTCTVAPGPDELVLNACSLLVPGRAFPFEIAANYVSFRLERDDAGDLARLSAFDQENDMRVQGELQRSRHAPALRGLSTQTTPTSTSRPRLPWDALGVDFGDGVLMDQAIVARAIDVEASGGDPVTARWSYRTISLPDSPRKLALSLSATINWQDLLGQVITLSLPAGTPDSVGKTMSNFMDVDFQLPRMAAPATAWELDDDAELAGLVKWGNLSLMRDTAECAGTCLYTGGVINACAEPGFAGQLDARDAAKLIVRVRTITKKRLGYPIELGIYLGEPALPDGGRSSTRELLMDRGEPQDTNFLDIVLPLSAGQRRERLPLEMRLVYGCRSGPSGENAPPAEATVLIERIAVE
ncbi:MAG TPA: hypothetical protein VMF89_33980 [Polyangiales bacterium]|nr:hypothetical protein [Polyangiales bacterium]